MTPERIDEPCDQAAQPSAAAPAFALWLQFTRPASRAAILGRSAAARFPIMNTQSKPCRNCGGTEFYDGAAARTVGITLFTIPPKFHLRLCGTCGLLDWFVQEPELQKLKKKFSP